MRASAQQSREWIDGFLFVGNHLALDFLNTRLVNEERPLELLPDTVSLRRCLNAAGLLKAVGKDPTAQTCMRTIVKFCGSALIALPFLRNTGWKDDERDESDDPISRAAGMEKFGATVLTGNTTRAATI